MSKPKPAPAPDAAAVVVLLPGTSHEVHPGLAYELRVDGWTAHDLSAVESDRKALDALRTAARAVVSGWGEFGDNRQYMDHVIAELAKRL